MRNNIIAIYISNSKPILTGLSFKYARSKSKGNNKGISSMIPKKQAIIKAVSMEIILAALRLPFKRKIPATTAKILKLD
jgi:hypothetical protein